MCSLRSCVYALGMLLAAGASDAQIDVPGSVLTQRNDVRRTGSYLHETSLTPQSVRLNTPGIKFDRLVIRHVDGQVAAQPLFVKGVVINGSPKNALYVATRK